MSETLYSDHDYKKDAKLLLHDVRQGFCEPCTDERKALHTIDLKYPLKCDCRCEKVEHLLRIARRIFDDKA
ncbi:MAG: hypothetical protein HOL66_00180 [Rhodospirillaceae bacterium]|nr:hypothetical protein [Rhodospirillaceae bacterium]MBT5242640.1 hypothetical protein [Rhodospirillaceae bacterium]MBT5562803.1 hypothetical protein [Rhodospirillaceae bacterium]MBT6241232.1 hypothetical protein [Rhodospirillaceae bacterium]